MSLGETTTNIAIGDTFGKSSDLSKLPNASVHHSIQGALFIGALISMAIYGITTLQASYRCILPHIIFADSKLNDFEPCSRIFTTCRFQKMISRQSCW